MTVKPFKPAPVPGPDTSSKTTYTNKGSLAEFAKAEKLTGGKGDNCPDSDFDPKQLAAGIKVEMEHTTDRDKAEEIAKDHLKESSDYYERLKVMESKMDANKSLEKANDLLKSLRDTLTKEKTKVKMDDSKARGSLDGTKVDEENSETDKRDLKKLPERVAKALKAAAIMGLSRRARMDVAYKIGVAEGTKARELQAEPVDLSGKLDVGVGEERLRPSYEPPIVPVRKVPTPNQIVTKPCDDHTYKTAETGPQEAKPFWSR